MTFSGSTFGRYSRRWLIAIGILELVLAAVFVVGALAIPLVGAGFLLTAAILGFTGLVLIVIAFLVGRSAAATDRISQSGIAGQATITGLTQTGMYLNQNPQVEIDLLVQLPGQPPYAARRKEFVPLILLGRLSSGAPLPVKVDQADRQKVVIDWPAANQPMAPGGMPSPAGQLAAANAPVGASAVDESLSQVQAALQQSGLQAAAPFAAAGQGGYTIEQLRAYLRASGIEGTARIDKLTDTGQIVGDERLYAMQVTLELPGRPPQQLAESAAMVPLTAMHRVHVGWKIPVRVAAENPNLMMFEWDKV
jgi:hypothetical protein